MRKRVWFKLLDRAERAIVDLTIRILEKVRSLTLKQILVAISEKLAKAITSQIAEFTETVGRSLAQKIANLAFSWGNREARKWSKDFSFVRYLAIAEMNTPKIYA